MKNVRLFLQVCKMTCIGGSERGTCSCDMPIDCYATEIEGYAAARALAVERMSRILADTIERRFRAAGEQAVSDATLEFLKRELNDILLTNDLERLLTEAEDDDILPQ